MLELDFKEFIHVLDMNRKQMDSDRRILHYEEKSGEFVLYLKSVDMWEYFTEVPKSEINIFGEQYEVTEEQAVQDFKRNFLYDARPLKEHVPVVLDMPEELSKGRVIAIGPRGGRIVGYDSHGKPIYEGSPGDTGSKKPPKKDDDKPDDRGIFEVLGEVTQAKKITVEPIYNDKLTDKWSGRKISVKIRPMNIDGHKLWFVIRNRKAMVYIQKPITGAEINASRDFDEKIYQQYLRAERQYNRLQIEEQKSFTKAIDVSEDIIDESLDYESFLTQKFTEWETKILSFVDRTLKDEFNKEVVNKSFGEFIQQLFNNVNTIGFKRGLIATIKASFKTGIEEVESELNIDIGFSPDMMTETKVMADRQLEGFYIEGKRWNGIKGVADDVQKEVSEIVRDGVVNRTGTKEIKNKIQERLEVTKGRATAIARTETTRFINHSKIKSYQESGLVEFLEWDAFLDNRTSEQCKHLDKKRVKLGKFWTLKDGTPVDQPPAHVNCRSIVRPILKKG